MKFNLKQYRRHGLATELADAAVPLPRRVCLMLQPAPCALRTCEVAHDTATSSGVELTATY